MDDKFFLPIATMLAGIVVFVAFAVWYALADKPNPGSLWPVVGVCLAAGGLIVFSGFS